MKFLVTWCWKGENSREVTERFKKWKPVGDIKFLFPVHSVIGAHKAFTVAEGDDVEAMIKNIYPWVDICTYEISPIVDSRELIKLLGA